MKVIGWQLMRLVAEAERDLVGSVVEQIRRSADRMRIVIVLGSRHGRVYVIIGVRGSTPAFYWTRERDQIPHWDSSNRTEVFNRLRSAQLTAALLPSADRIVKLEFERRAESEVETRVALIAGWLGSGSNVWLVDPQNDTILETLHSDPSQPRHRSAKPPALSLPPAPELTDWRALTFPEYRDLRLRTPDLPLSDFLRRTFWGIDTGLARQIEQHRGDSHAGQAGGESSTAMGDWDEFRALVSVARQVTAPHTPLMLPAGASDPGEIVILESQHAAGTSLAELLAQCDAQSPAAELSDDDRIRLTKHIELAMKKNEKRLNSLVRTLAEAGRAAEYQHSGDMLGANRDRVKRGLSEVVLDDWGSGTPVTIALNPARSPQQNIDDYYRKSRKAHEARQMAQVEQTRLQTEQLRLRQLMNRLAAEEESVDSVRASLEELGLLPTDTVSVAGGRQPRLPYREFHIGKHRLWVGKSSKDNDELTLRHARPHDLFFHVHGASGSHVILRWESRDVPPSKQILIQTAQVAAFFSKAKHAGLVPVVYTEMRHVRKPRKSPAGTVTIEREKTVMVRPLPPPGYHERTGAT